MGYGAFIAAKESGNYFDLVSDLVGEVWDFEDPVRRDQAKLDHYLRGDVNWNLISANDISYSSSIVDVSDMINWIESGK